MLESVVRLLPTPNASDDKGSGATQGRSRDGKPRPLSDADLPEAVKLLPTPMAGDAKGTRNATAGRKTDNPNVNSGWTLSDVVFSGQLLPTPTTSDGERTSSSYGRGNLTLTGAITNPPSDGGKPSSAALPPGPPTLWDD
jgi:hypothetical protein